MSKFITDYISGFYPDIIFNSISYTNDRFKNIVNIRNLVIIKSIVIEYDNDMLRLDIYVVIYYSNNSTIKLSGDCYSMFKNSKFNQDISSWDVSSVTDMCCMFNKSQFNQDISAWNVSSVTDMYRMFEDSKFNQDIGDWDISEVKNMSMMFCNSKFNQDISRWDVSGVTHMKDIFKDSKIQSEYKPMGLLKYND